MAEYHVGCGITAIFAGTLNKKGDAWIHKSDVTDEAFNAVAQYCLEHNQAMNFDYNGKQYRLAVTEIEKKTSNVSRKGENMVEVIKVKDCNKNIGDYDIPIHNAIIIPKGATNGDMVKALFPNCEQKEDLNNGYFEMYFENNMKNSSYMSVSKVWWNAPYMEGEK